MALTVCEEEHSGSLTSDQLLLMERIVFDKADEIKKLLTQRFERCNDADHEFLHKASHLSHDKRPPEAIVKDLASAAAARWDAWSQADDAAGAAIVEALK